MISKESKQVSAWVTNMAQVLAQEITKQMAGIQLDCCKPPPGEERLLKAMDAVYGRVEGDYRMELLFQAEPRLFSRLASSISGEEPEDEELVQEYATEFFNVLCGRFISELHEATSLSARFFPTEYEAPPNVTSIDVVGADTSLSRLYFLSDQQELVVFSWTIGPLENLLRRQKHG